MSTRILVVDDEPDVEALVLQKFRRQIRDGGISFLFARDGVEALNALKTNGGIDLVVTDINMPKVDGFGVLKWVRANPALSHLRVVMLTTSDESEDVDRAYLLGANSYLVKPISFDAYAELIGTAIRFWFEQSEAPSLCRNRPAPDVAGGTASQTAS